MRLVKNFGGQQAQTISLILVPILQPELEPRYEPFKKDCHRIAGFEGITVPEARDQDDCIEPNGEAAGEPMAQFLIYDDRMEVHWYSGTTEDEMNRYV